MNASELRGLKKEELTKELLDLLRERFNLRIQHSSGQLTRTHQLHKVKCKIAQVKTVIGELQRATKS